ncbi:inorganic phosphate transporter [Halopelagius longus]|uniref:Phosphate transporter n=1 Tax=Halopelagius longus TaxID=1236180 RepID=A0A1H1G040_9EURY|nr:inorganic phosphate transporter [Halopelagius longus]RDI69926.1 inorganic phosphate transporter [Halopelagius longus]SDR06515.1 inorganic phosphate transporter, PiT family [Halopelagius longus]
MISTLLVLGIAAAAFVGFNIGGSSTGVAWGPSIGADIIEKSTAAAFMVVFVLIGGWTVGRNVTTTLGKDIVPQSAFSIEASIVVLSFIGLGMLFANLYGVPISTSMTAVGAIAGLGLATNSLDWSIMREIIMWWLLAPIIGFWCGGVVGRYLYPRLSRSFEVRRSGGPLLTVETDGTLPTPRFGPGTSRREFVSTGTAFVIACYMSFSAGASNVANAVAPLVGGGVIGSSRAVLLGTAAIGVGAFTIARRTMESVGNGLTDLPLFAATVVMLIAASITAVASWLGNPISLALSTVMTIVGLGWGRASRTETAREIVRGDADGEASTDAVPVEASDEANSAGREAVGDARNAGELFDPSAVIRFVGFWIAGPSAATVLSYLTFAFVPILSG